MAFRVVSAGDVEYRDWRPAGWTLLLTVAALVGITLGLGLSLFWPRGPVGSLEYQLWRWETSTLLDNVFARVGIGPDPDEAAAERAIREYFRLTSEIRTETAKDQPDLQRTDALIAERAAHENAVERLFERYITGYRRLRSPRRSRMHLAKITWPPVDFD